MRTDLRDLKAAAGADLTPEKSLEAVVTARALLLIDEFRFLVALGDPNAFGQHIDTGIARILRAELDRLSGPNDSRARH